MASQPIPREEYLAAQRILAVTEEELQRIVLDIHDGPVQQLFAARAQLGALQARRARAEPLTEADYDLFLRRVTTLLDGALAEIRTFLGTFRPPDFARRPLADIVQGLLLQHEDLTGCEVDYLPPKRPLPVLSLSKKIALYRLCQEALSNAYRHAGTNQQWLRLNADDRYVTLEVWDKGKGFEPPPLAGPQATEREEHIGLRGMRERVALVGGVFALYSSPGKGTRITVSIPIEEEKKM
ncbi:MAG: sensor histidine kinase [Chloroflexota bacterium]